MRTEWRYISSDGIEFGDRNACVEHEAEMELVDFLNKRTEYSSEELARSLRLCYHMAQKREIK